MRILRVLENLPHEGTIGVEMVSTASKSPAPKFIDQLVKLAGASRSNGR